MSVLAAPILHTSYRALTNSQFVSFSHKCALASPKTFGSISFVSISPALGCRPLSLCLGSVAAIRMEMERPESLGVAFHGEEMVWWPCGPGRMGLGLEH